MKTLLVNSIDEIVSVIDLLDTQRKTKVLITGAAWFFAKQFANTDYCEKNFKIRRDIDKINAYKNDLKIEMLSVGQVQKLIYIKYEFDLLIIVCPRVMDNKVFKELTGLNKVGDIE